MAERVTEQLPIGTWILHQVSEFALQKKEETPGTDSILMSVNRGQLLVYRSSGPIMMPDHIREENRGVMLFWGAYRTRARLDIESLDVLREYMKRGGWRNGSLSGEERLERRVIIPLRDGQYNERLAGHKLLEALQATWDHAQRTGKDEAPLPTKSSESVVGDQSRQRFAEMLDEMVTQKG